jgi:hypothetical protein
MRQARFISKLKIAIWISLQVGLLFFARMNALAGMSSANFNIPSDTIGVSGGRSASGSYILEGTLGETGAIEDTSSASFKMCAGFQCFASQSFLGFSVKEGISRPGAVGAGVNLGALAPTTVNTSNGVDVNSIFITADSSSGSGVVISVQSLHGGLWSDHWSSAITVSDKQTLSAGTAGYGICVADAGLSGLTRTDPFDGACNPGAGHVVGEVKATPQTILTAPSLVSGGFAEILVKAAVATDTPGSDDYSDTLTFILSSTY